MTKILYALEKFPPEYSGAGVRAMKQARRLKDKFGHDLSIVCTSQGRLPENGDEELKVTRMKCFTGNNALLFPMHLTCTMIKSFSYLSRNKKNIDLIHFISFTWPNWSLAFWNNLLFHKKTILDVTLQGQDDPSTLLKVGIKNRIFSPITRMLLKKSDMFIVGSEEARQSCLNEGIAPERIVLEPHPCDEKEFETIPLSNKQKLRKKLGLPKNKFILMSVGRVQERKNQLAMAKAIALTGRKDICLVLIGPTEESDSYIKKIKDEFSAKEIPANIIITGVKKNVNEYMIASDAYMITSKSEGFPTSVSEAIVSGLPVISSYSGPTDEFIQSGKLRNGILVKRTDRTDVDDEALALSKAIMQIKIRKFKFSRENIRKYGKEHLSSSHIDLVLNENYSRLLKNGMERRKR